MPPEAVLSFTFLFSQDHPTPSGVSYGELPPLAASSTRMIPKRGTMTKHGTPRRRTDAEYAEMAADYEATAVTADEILSAQINPGFLPTNRHTKVAGKHESGLEDHDPKRSRHCGP